MDLTSPLPFRHQREPHMPKPLEIPAGALPRRLDTMARVSEAHRSNSLPPSAPSPRSPLPPHKLAKIANALGVNTPMPAFYRSPSPSGSSSFRSPSRFLLHIVPPAFLPSDEEDDGSDPEGASAVSASSYRSQFRRGTLVPLYPSLQSQLGAIAREYNLPSTGGLVLYLVQSSQGGALDGPRISDDVWKLLWHKALQAERQDSHPRSASLNLRSGRSTPSSPFNYQNRDLSQSTSTSRAPSSPFTYPSPSTSSTPSSDAHLPLSDKDNVSTPDLSITSDFTPNPFLPILAKVEFDIDRRKAGWYDAWAHGKRERSRWRSNADGKGKFALELPSRAESRSLRRFHGSSQSEECNEYALLDDGENENTAVDDEDEQDPDQATVVFRHQDPLKDVFGSDAATWNELHAGRHGKKIAGLGINTPFHEPASGGEDDDMEGTKTRDEDDVVKLWDENRRPTLPFDSLDPHTSPRKGAPPPLNLVASDSMPPPPSPNPGRENPPGTFLPYLGGLSPSDSGSPASDSQSERRTKRRTGMVFGDLEVKIVSEPEEMSEQESATNRSSQMIMKNKLDQLERQLAQLSPRQLSSSPPPSLLGPLEYENDRPLCSAPAGVDKFNVSPPMRFKAVRSFNGSPRAKNASNPATPPPRENSSQYEQYPPRNDSLAASAHFGPPRLQEHKRARSSQSSSGSSSKSHPEQRSSVTKQAANPSSLSAPPSKGRSPPQLTLKRASGGPRNTPDISDESRARMFDDGQDILLPVTLSTDNPSSPLFPLSPDPFGRRPMEDPRQNRHSNESAQSIATESRPPSRLQGTVLPASVPENAELETQSSRFSADSEQSVEHLTKQRRSRSGSVMSVRGLRNLWRKSNASGKGGVPPVPTAPEPSPTLMSPVASSQHTRGESSGSQRSMRPPTERTRRPSAASRPDSGSDPFQFDNANIYKSPSSSSLASAVTSPTGPGPNYASMAGSIGQSKGILKGRTGSTNPPDVGARRPGSPKRSTSTASASFSDLGERSADSQHSSPPSSPPTIHRVLVQRKTPPLPQEPSLFPHSLPGASAMGLSRYPEAAPSSPHPSFDDGSTPRFGDFEIVSPPTRSTPSSSYTGEVHY